jgi:hypothetical protein
LNQDEFEDIAKPAFLKLHKKGEHGGQLHTNKISGQEAVSEINCNGHKRSRERLRVTLRGVIDFIDIPAAYGY